MKPTITRIPWSFNYGPRVPALRITYGNRYLVIPYEEGYTLAKTIADQLTTDKETPNE